MSEELLELCKLRVMESQKRMQELHAKLQAVNAEYQLAAQEASGWQLAYNSEVKRIEKEKSGEGELSPIPIAAASGAAIPDQAASGETNKTETVRDLLRRHPNGMTPAEIWKEVRTQFAHRPYLYSVLKRLSDKGDIKAKRKKYYFQFQPKSGEEKQHVIIVQ